MKSFELEDLSIEELADLRDRTIATLADKVAERQRELQAEMERVAGFVSTKGATAPSARKAAAQYRGPNGEEWSGRGPRPKWVEEELALGRPLQELKAA
jgi:DNA-binding protein H-NS